MNKPKYYIVDDEPEDRLMIKDWLSEIGIDALPFPRIGMMLEAYDYASPGVVIMDYQMCTNGFDSWQMMKYARLGHVPVIFVSSGASPEIAKRCLDEGAIGFMSKDPINKPMFLSCVQSIGHRRKLKDFETRRPVELFADLSPRELTMWELAAIQGVGTQEVAMKMGVKETSIGTMRSRIAAKLGFANFTDAVTALKNIPMWLDDCTN